MYCNFWQLKFSLTPSHWYEPSLMGTMSAYLLMGKLVQERLIQWYSPSCLSPYASFVAWAGANWFDWTNGRVVLTMQVGRIGASTIVHWMIFSKSLKRGGISSPTTSGFRWSKFTMNKLETYSLVTVHKRNILLYICIHDCKHHVSNCLNWMCVAVLWVFVLLIWLLNS